MESLKFTQFAHVAPNTQGLPPQLAKRLEKAIVKAYMKNTLDLKKSHEEKMHRAQAKREEQLSLKAAKLYEHSDRVRDALERKLAQPSHKQELYQEIHQTKMQIAELRALEHRQKQLLKAQEMGTVKVLRAQKNRELLNAQNESKKIAKPNRGIFKVKLVYEIQEKNKQRNYEIMKNLNRKRFQSVSERQKKAQSLEEKLQKANERRQLIINKKIQTAIDLGLGNSVVHSNVSNNAQASDNQEICNLSSLLKISKIVPNPQSIQEETKAAESDSDFEMVSNDDVDLDKKEKLDAKMNKVSESYKSNLDKIIQKARDSYTKFGPSPDERKMILSKRRAQIKELATMRRS